MCCADRVSIAISKRVYFLFIVPAFIENKAICCDIVGAALLLTNK